MADITSVGTPPVKAPLTAQQQAALKKLHEAAQQFEGVFIDMIFKEMRKTESDVSLTGKKSQGEKIFGEMLDDERSKQMAQSGSLGIGKVLENQLRSAVLANAPVEAQTPVDGSK